MAARSPRLVRVVSLERALSKLGVASRVEARALVLAGRVRVGGRVVTDPARRVDPARDRLRVDDRSVRAAAALVWMLHKPVGCVTTRTDPDGRKTVYAYLPRELPFLAPVGRLDLDSSGLLLFTNDTHLAARLTDPERHVPKTYEVALDAVPAPEALARLREGVVVTGRRTRPAVVAAVGAGVAGAGGAGVPRLRITLTEGRNRQVRRMLEAVGHRVVALHRTRIGPLALGALPSGESRALRPTEVRALRAACGARDRGE